MSKFTELLIEEIDKVKKRNLGNNDLAVVLSSHGIGQYKNHLYQQSCYFTPAMLEYFNGHKTFFDPNQQEDFKVIYTI